MWRGSPSERLLRVARHRQDGQNIADACFTIETFQRLLRACRDLPKYSKLAPRAGLGPSKTCQMFTTASQDLPRLSQSFPRLSQGTRDFPYDFSRASKNAQTLPGSCQSLPSACHMPPEGFQRFPWAPRDLPKPSKRLSRPPKGCRKSCNCVQTLPNMTNPPARARHQTPSSPFKWWPRRTGLREVSRDRSFTHSGPSARS